MDKDLGSPETSAEIARAFGVTEAERVESITVVGGCQCKHGVGFSACELCDLEIPLNLNWHDLAHPANACIKDVLFKKGAGDHWLLNVEFA